MLFDQEVVLVMFGDVQRSEMMVSTPKRLNHSLIFSLDPSLKKGIGNLKVSIQSRKFDLYFKTLDYSLERGIGVPRVSIPVKKKDHRSEKCDIFIL